MPAAFRSDCPIASALDILGDKWSLVIIRSMMLGAHSFQDFHRAPEKIATNILADRLQRLQAWGLIETTPARPGARGGYRLTASGADILPLLQTLARWGEAHLENRSSPPDWFLKATPADVLARASRQA
ncbi:helix-turn-helix domain-containing protein [Phenylobacterium sp.]|uniref:winged helix-turn-helix transcriptional regulator n=1 Tax=Phenylobacterium sp. TaxID=1871053 RepID=UPI0030F3894D